jgi:hypothetical protein
MAVGQLKLTHLKVSEDELASQIQHAVLEQIAADKIALPAMPRVATRAF